MHFHEGDPVMHWSHGLGQIVCLEERTLSGSNTLYYAVQVRELTVWVPADGKLGSRLRTPTLESDFEQLLAILSSPSESLPGDRHERKAYLVDLLKDGRAESICRIVRDCSAYQKDHSLNDNDQALLKEAREALLAEWGYVRSLTRAQTELELHRLLTAGPPEIKE